MNKTGYFLAAAGLALLLSPHPAAAQKPSSPEHGPEHGLTLERISAEPDPAELPSSVHWSHDGDRVAWTHILRPLRTLAPTTAGPGSHSPTQGLPTAPIDLNPQAEIWSLTPSSAAPTLLVTAAKVTAALRGTDTPPPPKFDTDDEDPNPNLLHDFTWSNDHSALLLAGGISIAWLDLATGKSHLLVSGEAELSSIALSPDGKTLSFVRDHSLWLVSVTGSAQPRLLAKSPHEDVLAGEADWSYQHELGTPRASWWSPDSTRIAYFETNDRAVAKYALHSSDGETRTIPSPKPGGDIPSVRLFIKAIAGIKAIEVRLPPISGDPKSFEAHGFYLARVAWLPDGHTLAVERLSRNQHTLQLFLADAVTGVSRLVLTETDEYWINLGDTPIFLKDGKRFLWTSERTGFRHIYLYDTTGKQLVQITRGDWEVTHINSIDEAKGLVYFTSTAKSPLERHLYSVSLDTPDAAPVAITSRPGTHQVFVAPGTAGFLDVFSSQTQPPLPFWRSFGSAPEEAPTQAIAPAIASLNLQPVEFVKPKTHMDLEVNAFLIRPPNFDPSKKYPVIVYMAGGPGEQLVRNVWGGGDTLWMQYMAQKGFLVFALDHHGTAGRGHYFEEPLHLRFSAQELIDQRDGLAYLKTLPWADLDRLGVCGWGYGGFLTIHAMLDRPVPFRAGFAGAAVTDWHFYNAIFAERYLEDPDLHADGWDASTALENALYFKGSLMLAQGTDDEVVHVENTLTLQDKLVDFGKSADIFLLPDRGHVLDDPLTRLAVYRRMTDFFIKSL